MEGNEKNLNLSEAEFDSLLQDLKQGDNALFEKLFVSQSRKCMDFLIRSYQMPYDMAYDFTIEAIIVMRQRLVDGKVRHGNLQFLFFQIAKHLFFKSKRKQPFVELSDHAEVLDIDNHPQYSDEEIEILHEALHSLNADCKLILQLYHYQSQKLYEIAEALGKTHDAIRKQKERCQKRLIEKFNEFKTVRQ